MDNRLIFNRIWCVATPLVNHAVADYYEAIHLTTTSVEKNGNEVNCGVEGDGLYKAVKM